MSRVGQKDTGPELKLRQSLHRDGLRYRLHDKSLPGSPDLVFRRFNAVMFVHGCYWHSHGCYRSTLPKTRRTFWKRKFFVNRKRDKRNISLLQACGWRVLVVWECALVGRHALPMNEITESCRSWLVGSDDFGCIPERPADDKP